MERLVATRTTLRSIITRTANRIEEMLASGDVASTAVEEKLEILSQKAASLNDTQQKINDLVEVSSLPEEIEGHLVYEERLAQIRTRARQVLHHPPSSGSGTQGTAPQRPAGPHTPSRTVALPKLQIETFDGTRTAWSTFWDHYSSTIHTRPDLPKVEKFKYLRSYLTGAAKRAIDFISLSDANYDRAVAALTERFGRPDLIVQEHVSTLLAVTAVRSSSDVHLLRSLYDHVVFCIRSLENLGVPPVEYAVVLHSVLLRALPDDLSILYRQKIKEDSATSHSATASDTDSVSAVTASNVEKMLAFLRVQVESREELAHTSSAKPGSNPVPKAPHTSSASALAASIRSSQHTPCLFCSSATHWVDSCPSALSFEEKKARLQREDRCFKCAKKYHAARNCRSCRSLRCARCNGRHLTTLCNPSWGPQLSSGPGSPSGSPRSLSSAPLTDPPQPLRGQVPPTSSTSSAPSPVTQTSSSLRHSGVFLQTAIAYAKGATSQQLIRMLLDGGSQQTFIRKDLASDLGAELLSHEDITVFAFGNERLPVRHRCRRVRVTLKSQDSANVVEIQALEIPEICRINLPTSRCKVHCMLQKLYLPPADLQDETLCPEGISLLIGCDYYWKVVTGRIHRLAEFLTAVETIFGWTPQGRLGTSAASSSSPTVLCLAVSPITTDNQDDTPAVRMWELDTLGIESSTSKDDPQVALARFDMLVKKRDNRYEVPLMVQENSVHKLRNNRTIAFRRLQSQLKRFRSEPELLKQYDDTIREYFLEHHAERVPQQSSPNPTYYLPHHAVVRQDAITTKIRVVFDASSHVPGSVSLNGLLDKGPNLNAALLELLVQFRLYAIVLTADIRKAYLQIVIRPEDRDLLRFLWVESLPSEPGHATEVAEWRMTRVPFGASSSPFLLAATVQRHLREMENLFPDTVQILRRGFYVDDLVVGADSEEQALTIYQEARCIFSRASMELRKWASNSSPLRQHFLHDGVSYDNVTAGSPPVLKVLGVSWDRYADEILIRMDRIHQLAERSPRTKRVVLHCFSRIFDPLGLIHPFTVRARLLFQSLWRTNIPWDENIPQDLSSEWNKWCEELLDFDQLRLPRRVTCSSYICHGQIHVFTDASPRAYGAAVYIRSTNASGDVTCRLLLSKVRLAPLKSISLPRLELLGALIGARLRAFLRHIPRLAAYSSWRFWTDSTIALHWIQGNPSRWDQFVRNRVLEVQKLTSSSEWQHCPGGSNPADALTRGTTASHLSQDPAWWSGPPRLTKGTDYWPQQHQGSESIPTTILPAVVSPPPSATEPVFDPGTYSSILRTLRVTAWILRFKTNSSGTPIQRRRGPLSAVELREAENYWVRQTQQRAYTEELAAIRSKRPIRSSSSIATLSPFLDDDSLIRVGGRLQHLPASDALKHPLLLPARHPFTDLVIRAAHARLLHAGIQHTLTEIRERYWIVRGRQAVKRIINGCQTCRRQRLQSSSVPTGPLQSDRLSSAVPFLTTGVDFAGPLLVQGTKHGSKSYIAVFSCATTRALHLELVTDMSAPTFLLAFRRFIARRGVPSVIYSDNATTFHRCAQDLQAYASVTDDQVQDYASTINIDWRFSPPRSPWWGGWWERMIRTIKDALRKTLKNACLRFEELNTVLHEVEAVVNSRPLTYVGTDPQEAPPVTPADFLIGKRITALPCTPPTNCESSPASLRRRLKRREKYTRDVCRRWKRDYILQLRSAHHRGGQRHSHPPLQEGNVVLLEDSSPAQFWKMGIIVQSYQGADGATRLHTVRLADGSEKLIPAQRLCLLEAGQPAAGGGC